MDMKYAAIPHPLQAEINQYEKEKLFAATCYNVLTTISTDDKQFIIATAFLDTRAGPNLDVEDTLPTTRLKNVRQIRAIIWAAGKNHSEAMALSIRQSGQAGTR